MEGKKVLIIGAGIDSVQSALDQAAAGNKVYFLERPPGLGSLAADDASFSSKWEEARSNKNIHIITNGVLNKVRRENGGFQLEIKKTAPRVIEEKCNDCKECIKVCPISLWPF
ncbi:MAG: NAD-binding protein [Thermodesulfobacteriota bacterium]|nr:NAD-binding protein [Thermodesulfobacteriota bacterium]